MALKASFLATGLTTPVHGNARKLPKHALNLDEMKNLVTLSNYAQENMAFQSGQNFENIINMYDDKKK